jgi:hypothetical protein
MSDNPPWLPGQRAIIDRRTVVTIDRVTPSGRAVVGDRTFEANGFERRGGHKFRILKLEAITPEIDLIIRGTQALHAAHKELEAADNWLRRNLSTWGPRIPDAPDVDRAERLAAAIRQVMEGVG